MEIKELRCFVRVAETLNFKRAAELLNMSQPAVTKTVALLEHKLGVKLFERTTRRVALTEAGVMLMREADGLLQHIDRVQRDVRHALSDQSGHFAIGVTPLAMRTVFPGIMRDFQKRYPATEVQVQELPTDTQLRQLLSAEIDIAFLLAPSEHPEIEVRIIHQEQMRLAVPANHPQLNGRDTGPLPLSAFAGDDFIIPPRAQNPGIHDEIIRACASSGFRPHVKDCSAGQSCLCLVEAGMGVSFVTSRIGCTIGEDVRIIDLQAPAPCLSVALAWRKDDPSVLLKTIRDLATPDKATA